MSASREDLGRINVAGTIEQKRYAFEDGPRTLSQFAAVYVTDGEGFFENERGARMPAMPGALILLVPGTPHRYGPHIPGRWSEIYFVFEGALFECWRDAAELSESRVTGPLLPVEHWKRRFRALFELTEEDRKADPLVIACRLQTVLAEATAGGQSAGTDECPRDPALFRESVGAIIERDLRYDLDFRLVAEELGLGYESFRKRFRAAFGQSPHRYLAARVVRRASLRLRDPATLDKEVAAELGFSDEHYFSRRFHQIAGMSPTEYRRAYGQDR